MPAGNLAYDDTNGLYPTNVAETKERLFAGLKKRFSEAGFAKMVRLVLSIWTASSLFPGAKINQG